MRGPACWHDRPRRQKQKDVAFEATLGSTGQKLKQDDACVLNGYAHVHHKSTQYLLLLASSPLMDGMRRTLPKLSLMGLRQLRV